VTASLATTLRDLCDSVGLAFWVWGAFSGGYELVCVQLSNFSPTTHSILDKDRSTICKVTHEYYCLDPIKPHDLLTYNPWLQSKMFFLYNLERQVTLHPSYFGRNMHELVTGKLLKDVEGTCTGRYYIITVMDTFDVSEGRILPGSGLAEFTVRYRAVVWRPFKGETVDAIVTGVNFEGFLAMAGPLQLFVSRELISKDIKFDPNATPWQWTDNEDQVIEQGAQVRVKLLGIRSDVGAMYAIGSIKEDYLGVPPA